jgi:hypothetical protein
MNKLDDKVIIDREVFVGILDMARRGLDTGFFGDTFHQDFNYGEQALAADLTGWVAVPVVQTQEMLDAGKNEYQMVLATFGQQYKFDAIGEACRAMVAASPPLPGTGE